MSEKVYKIGDFTFNASKREFAYKNNSINLSSRAFDILDYLLENQGKVVTKDELLDKVWADSFVEESNLAVHISAIRRVLKERKGETKYIKTISGRGYSFVSDVKEVSENSKFSKHIDKPQANKVFTDKKRTSLAILPLVFVEEENNNEYLANGITQSLISDLSKSLDLRVLSYSAVKRYKNTETDLQEVGFLLDAEKLFKGYIYENDSKLSITVELINASDKSSIWGDEYFFEKDDIFKVKKEISNVIAEKLKLKVSPQASEQEINVEAQKLYYRGKYTLELRSTNKNPKQVLNSAIEYFKKAIEIEPNYALAYVGIGTANVSLHNHNLRGTETYDKARKALSTALKINPTLSEAYVLKGSIEVMFDDNLQEAKKSFNKAGSLNSNNPDAYHWKGLVCMFLGEYEEALKLETIATKLDPTSIRFNGGIMRIFFYSEDFNKSIIQAEELLEFDEKLASAYLFLAYNNAHLGNFELAVKYIDIGLSLREREEYFLIKAYVYALFNKKEEALEIVKNIQHNSEPIKIDSRDIAVVYSALNEKEKTIEYLQKALEDKRYISFVKTDIRFKNLKNYKKLDDLIPE